MLLQTPAWCYSYELDSISKCIRTCIFFLRRKVGRQILSFLFSLWRRKRGEKRLVESRCVVRTLRRNERYASVSTTSARVTSAAHARASRTCSPEKGTTSCARGKKSSLKRSILSEWRGGRTWSEIRGEGEGDPKTHEVRLNCVPSHKNQEIRSIAP